MGQFIDPVDLDPFATIDPAKAAAMVADAESRAILTAPCLPGLLTAPVDETPEAASLRQAKLDAVRSILRGAILRWNDSGSGAITQQQVGPFGQSIQQPSRRGMFWPSEITELQGLCRSARSAFTVDVVPADEEPA